MLKDGMFIRNVQQLFSVCFCSQNMIDKRMSPCFNVARENVVTVVAVFEKEKNVGIVLVTDNGIAVYAKQ